MPVWSNQLPIDVNAMVSPGLALAGELIEATSVLLLTTGFTTMSMFDVVVDPPSSVAKHCRVTVFGDETAGAVKLVPDVL